MYFTHYFAHPETLARFESWLTCLGIKHQPVDPQKLGIPRIALKVEPSRIDAIRMLVSAVERNDPDGFPSFWEMAALPHGHPVVQEARSNAESHPPHYAVIGWHPNDSIPASDPEFRELCEAMGRKWGNA